MRKLFAVLIATVLLPACAIKAVPVSSRIAPKPFLMEKLESPVLEEPKIEQTFGNPLDPSQDFTAPTVSVAVPTSSSTYDNGTSTTLSNFSGTSSDAGGVAICKWSNSLTGGAGTLTTSASGSWSITNLTLAVGSNILTVTCYDPANNAGTTTLTVTVSTGSSPTNPISATRQACGSTAVPNACWATAGVQGGIPTTRTRCTTGTGTSVITAYTGSAATINTAISGCNANHYVELGAGTFQLSSCILLGTNNVSLRGQGADSTKIIITSLPSSGCAITGTFLETAVRLGSTTANIACTTNCGGGTGPNNSTTWTAGYTQGATSITLGSIPTTLTVGGTIWLDQLNDASDGYPAAGDIYVCDSGDPTNCSWEGGNAWARAGRAQQEAHVVVSCGTSTPGAACTSSSLVISDGLIAANWRSARTPGAWWGSTSAQVTGVGIENLSLDFTGAGQFVSGVGGVNCTNCWVRGLRIVFTGNGSQTFHLNCINCLHVTWANNYLFGTVCPGFATGMCNIQYTISPQGATMLLVENNIIQHSVTPVASNDPEIGSVYGYNYVVNAYYSPGPQDHNSGDLYNLWEGNGVGSFFNDVIHGTHHFLTYFRNHGDGTANNTTGVSSFACFAFWAHNRFHNMLGNVCGSNAFATYQYPETSDSFNGVFALGFKGSHGGSGVLNDAFTRTTSFRWGNWDNVTSTGDTGTNDQTGIRWCGSATALGGGPNTGWTTRCSSTTEVPSTLTNFSNPIPSAETLPNSLYLSAKPAFFQSITWPPIGPDVSGGNAPNTSSAPTGGHANKIPARVCFESLSNDLFYGTTYSPNSQRVKTFNAATCYGS